MAVAAAAAANKLMTRKHLRAGPSNDGLKRNVRKNKSLGLRLRGSS